MSSQAAAPTTVRGHWLLLARAVWVVLVVLVLVFWSLGTAALVSEPLPDCAEVTCDPVDFNAGDVEVARELGLPTGLFRDTFSSVGAIVPGLLFFIIGGIIFWRRSSDWMALLASFTLVYIGGLFFTSSDDALARTYPGLDLAVGIVDLIGIASMALVFYLFPDGRFVPRWTRWMAGVAAALILLAELTFVFGAISFLLLITTGLFAQVYRYTRVSGPVQRQQTKWVVFGLMGAVGLMLTWLFVSVAFPPDKPSSGRIYALLVVDPVLIVLMLLLPLSFAVSILRYRLYDIDIFVNRALVYRALTAALVGTYVGIIVGIQAAFRSVTDQGSGVAIVISTLVIAALFQPVRRRVQDFIDRRFYRRRYDAAQTLAAFGDRMRDEVDLGRLSQALVDVVDETMQPAHVSLWLNESTRVSAPVSDGLRPELRFQQPRNAHRNDPGTDDR